MDSKIQPWQLAQRQAMPLWMKEEYTKKRIIQWYEYWEGKVYVSFSGGKDSTVLLDQVRKIYPDVIAVFSDTGLEYPEIREFVKTIDNVAWIKPKINFREVINKYGYPIISKEVSMSISRYINTKSLIQKELRLHGGVNPTSGKIQKVGVIPKKYQYLINAPFAISEGCCNVLKKQPFKVYERATNKKPYIGTMASDSSTRKINYTRFGCNSFNQKHSRSTPMAFWLESDIWEYIHKYNLPYSKIYDMGYSRTGCMFCMFGVHLEKSPNRFQQMKETHPKQYDFCMNKLGIKEVLEFINIQYE